jgi:uncharacterized repeat protein (TIGR03843 family)
LSSVIDSITRGELIVEGRFVDASNATLFAKCVYEDLEVPVIYKPIAGERPLWDFPDGNLANRELAAYLLSEALEFHLVPFTIVRDGPFGSGMVQEWIEIDESIDVVDLVNSNHPRIRSMTLFDAIINNTDRKYGHILPTSDGQIFGCDHGVTFHEDPKLRTVLWHLSGVEFSTSELELLKQAHEVSASVVEGLITEAETEALLARIERLLEAGTYPEPSNEWPPVPWPPF